MSPTLALFALCVGVSLWAALPLLPALIELYRRHDVVPLPVTTVHQRDLRIFAWVFRNYVRGELALLNQAPAGAQQDRRSRFSDGTTVHLVDATTPYVPDIADRRRRQEAERERVVVSSGPLVVPDGVRELGHVYATDTLVGGSDCVYRSVLCEGDVELGDRSVVLRWIHAEGALHAGSGSRLVGRTTAEVRIQIDEGCSFERLYARRIVFGAGGNGAAVPAAAVPDRARASASAVSPQRIAGNYTVPPHTCIASDLIVLGTLTVGEHCLLLGSLKARQRAEIGRGTQVGGSITVVGTLYIGRECIVQGALVGEHDIFIDQRTRIGSEAVPTTVTAQRIYVAPGTIAHGVVWARQWGSVARF